MLELLYIGRFDYLARQDIHKPTRLPDDIEVEAALRDLDAAQKIEREEKLFLDGTASSERQTNKLH